MSEINWEDATALVDGYTPQELYMAYKKVETLPSFLTGMLVNRSAKNHTTKEFSFDIKSEGATIPTYCTPKSSTSLVEFGGFQTVRSTTPYINEGFEVTVDDFDTRVEGVDAATWGQLSMGQRMALILSDKDRQMKNRIGNIAEVQMSQQLQTGVIPVSGSDVDMEISIRMPANHKVILTGDARWSQAASEGTRIASIKSEIIKMRSSRGGMATDIIMSDLAFSALQSDPEFFERLNFRNTPQGTYDPKIYDNGGYIQKMGVLQIDGFLLTLWVNSAVYTDNAGTETPYIADWNYVLVNKNVPFRQHWGRIDNMNAWKAGMATSDMFTYFDEDRNGKWLRKVYETAPVVACEDATGIVVVTTHM